MARPLVIGNGRMLVCLDDHMIIRDFYYPQVGQVNHIAGKRNQFGLWADGDFTWLSDEGWERNLSYRSGTLVAESQAVHQTLGLELTLRDAVLPQSDIFVRCLHIRNRQEQPREVRLFATFDFEIDESDMGDTALWDPNLGAVLHYKRNRWFLIGASGPQGGIAQYATGRKRFQGAEGTWRDAEDGHLEGHPISQGSVDSTISLHLSLGATEGANVYLWVVCAQDYHGARAGHAEVVKTGAEAMLAEVDRYWRTWATSGQPDPGNLSAELQEAYRRSLLIVRTQVDNGGAILAANDSDILAHNRDHYSYMWPRDGAFVAAALDRAGYGTLTRPFYRFCAAGLSDEGFLWHKYNPDGSLGSSWHPWVGAKGIQLPIQEDESALVLWALANHYRLHRDHQFIGSLYTGLIRPIADFLVRYRSPLTHLPEDSYDLWEERRGVFTFTVAAVVAGLTAGSELAAAVGDAARSETYRTAAQETKEAMLRYLWSEAEGSFLRGVYVRQDGTLVPDTTPESSVLGVFLLGVLPPDDPRVVATVHKLEAVLWARTTVGGIARYQNDYYFRVVDDTEIVPGNPWIICTLWVARWYVATAHSRDDLRRALDLIDWALRHALPSGVFPEQVHPLSGEPLSVAPLTWSHATLVDTLLDLSQKLSNLPTNPPMRQAIDEYRALTQTD